MASLCVVFVAVLKWLLGVTDLLVTVRQLDSANQAPVSSAPLQVGYRRGMKVVKIDLQMLLM